MPSLESGLLFEVLAFLSFLDDFSDKTESFSLSEKSAESKELMIIFLFRYNSC